MALTKGRSGELVWRLQSMRTAFPWAPLAGSSNDLIRSNKPVVSRLVLLSRPRKAGERAKFASSGAGSGNSGERLRDSPRCFSAVWKVRQARLLRQF